MILIKLLDSVLRYPEKEMRIINSDDATTAKYAVAIEEKGVLPVNVLLTDKWREGMTCDEFARLLSEKDTVLANRFLAHVESTTVTPIADEDATGYSYEVFGVRVYTHPYGARIIRTKTEAKS